MIPMEYTEDSGWIEASPLIGSGSIYYKKKNGVVTVNGYVTGITESSSWATLFNLPTGYNFSDGSQMYPYEFTGSEVSINRYGVISVRKGTQARFNITYLV